MRIERRIPVWKIRENRDLIEATWEELRADAASQLYYELVRWVDVGEPKYVAVSINEQLYSPLELFGHDAVAIFRVTIDYKHGVVAAVDPRHLDRRLPVRRPFLRRLWERIYGR